MGEESVNYLPSATAVPVSGGILNRSSGDYFRTDVSSSQHRRIRVMKCSHVLPKVSLSDSCFIDQTPTRLINGAAT